MQRHIIHKQKVRLHLKNEGQIQLLQDTVSHMFGNGLADGIERLLNEAARPDEVIRIDRLVVNLSDVSAQNFEKEFKAKFLAEFDKKLSAAVTEAKWKGNDGAFYTPSQSLYSSLLYFLEPGVLPWYTAKKTIGEWEKEIMSSFTQHDWHRLFVVLKQYYTNQPSALERFVLQFSDALLKNALLAGVPALRADWNNVYEDLLQFAESHSRAIKDIVWLSLYRKVVDFEDDTTWYLYRVIASIVVELKPRNLMAGYHGKWQSKFKSNQVIEAVELITKKQPVEVETPVQSNKKSETENEKVLFVQNSGVVLLHPFLQMYFKGIGLLNEANVFLDEAAQRRAVLLINYLATGACEAAEYDLALQKLLCGLQFDDAIPAFIELTKQEEEEAGNLLVAVTRHWPPLNNTSVEGLRGTFLQREGKLSQTFAGWQLHVEYKTVDILLGKLPWSFSAIKLPWMDSMLNVSWH